MARHTLIMFGHFTTLCMKGLITEVTSDTDTRCLNLRCWLSGYCIFCNVYCKCYFSKWFNVILVRRVDVRKFSMGLVEMTVAVRSLGKRGFTCYHVACKKPRAKSKMDLPTNIYSLKVNNRNSRKRCEMFSQLTIKTPERQLWLRSCVFFASFKHISYLFPMFLLLAFNK